MNQRNQKSPLCPKCKQRRMVKNGFRKGRQVWVCKMNVDGETIRCYETYNPDVPARTGGAAKPIKVRKAFRRKIDTSPKESPLSEM